MKRPERNDPRRSTLEPPQPPAAARHSTTCSAAPPRAGPTRMALIDPPNRESFTDGAPRRLTYAEADRIVSAIAARLRGSACRPTPSSASSLPNTVEGVVALLGVLRAGMIAAPMPLLWRARRRRRRAVPARRQGASSPRRASAASILPRSPCRSRRTIFSIRHVCGFGRDLARWRGRVRRHIHRGRRRPAAGRARGQRRSARRAGDLGRHARRRRAGRRAATRELIAGGLATLLEGRLRQDATLLGAFAADVVRRARRHRAAMAFVRRHVVAASRLRRRGVRLAMPSRTLRHRGGAGPDGVALADAGLLSHAELASVLALWRAPERLSISPPWRHATATLTDCWRLARSRCSARAATAAACQCRCRPARHGRAARPGQRRAGCGTGPHRGRHARRARPDGAAACIPARRRAPQPHRPEDRRRRLCRYRLCVPARYGGRHHHGDRAPPGIVSVGGYRFHRAGIEQTVRSTRQRRLHHRAARRTGRSSACRRVR